MSDARRWIVAVLLAVLLIGLVAYARGAEHHRGQQVGSPGAFARTAWVT